LTHLAVSAIGVDQPGIVAAVTGVLVDRGCNLEDTSMSILRGHFAMMLVVSAPDGESAASLEEAVSVATGSLELVVVVRAIDDEVRRSPPGEPWSVSVYGADRPGIVHRVATVLASAGANIVDLTTRVIGDDQRPVYAMFLDVSVPSGTDADALVGDLEAMAAELGVSCTAHPADADIL
jgi:glycine cleavage system transcriptional repressor